MKLKSVLLPFTLMGCMQAQQTPTVRTIAVDLSRPTRLHDAMPLQVICAGRAEEGLRADWQRQLSTMQHEIGFRYLRFHGLLAEDMGIYSEDARGRPAYQFRYLDELYDAMLAQHIRPFVEFSFTPARLASGERTVFWWKGNISPPRDMAKWNGLIGAIMEHLRARYGAEEIAQWYFEVWNEPDLPNFWTGTEAQYFDLYRNTAQIVKSVCPACKVGGPASAVRGLETRWLAFIANEHVPADFLSTHAYGVYGQTFDAQGNAVRVTGDPVTRVRETRATLDSSATPQLELEYTEWNSRYSPTHPIHDQYIAAPFILEQLKQASGLLQGMAYWTFTDIFEEDGPRLAPFHGGFGLMTLEGVRKPAYFAYKFLAQLGPEDLPSADPESWVTRKADGSVQVLFWNYTAVQPPPGEAEESFFRHEQPTVEAGPVTVAVSGLRAGKYRLKTYAVGHLKNDAYSAYLAMGSPMSVSRQQADQLQKSATGDPLREEVVEVSKGQFSRQIPLEQNEAVLMVLAPL